MNSGRTLKLLTVRIYSGIVKRTEVEEEEEAVAASSNDRSCLLCPDCFTLEPIISRLFQ